MKKTLMIAVAALAMGTVAVAQDMPAQTPASPTPDMQATPPANSTGPAGTAQPSMPADQNGATAPGAPGDASMGATPPPAGNAAAATAAAGSTDTSNYPPCSRGQTDKCVQKGGMGHKRAAHHMMRHRK